MAVPHSLTQDFLPALAATKGEGVRQWSFQRIWKLWLREEERKRINAVIAAITYMRSDN